MLGSADPSCGVSSVSSRADRSAVGASSVDDQPCSGCGCDGNGASGGALAGSAAVEPRNFARTAKSRLTRTFYAPEREPQAATNVALLHVTGMDNFVLPVAKYTFGTGAIAKASGSGPSGSFLGSDLRYAYYGSGSLNGAGQTLAIYAYKGYNPTDINTYFANAGQSQNVPIVSVSVN